MERRKRFHLPKANYSGTRIYFVTVCSSLRASVFCEATLAAKVLSILKDEAACAGFVLHAWCLLPDHLHILAEGVREDSDLLRFISRFKRRTAAVHLPNGAKLWQRNFYEHIVRRREALGRIAAYIWMNPVRKGLCEFANEYGFSGSLTMPWTNPEDDPWIPPWKRNELLAGR